MISAKIKKGFDLNINGKPSLDLKTLENPTYVAAVPERIPFIKPKLHVDIGDSVNIGSILFVDKKRPDIKFLSPGSGKITEINYGRRRVIQEIVIKLSENEQKKKLPTISESQLSKTKKEKLAGTLMEGGVWPFIKALPFREIAHPAESPSSIWVCLDQKDPFQPDSRVYLHDQEVLFSFGLKILKQFSSNLYVVSDTENTCLPDNYKKYISHAFTGKYPADDPGVMLYQTKKSSDENYAWYINGQDLIALAQMAKTGQYPINRVVTVSGDSEDERVHVKTRLGVRIEDLLPNTSKQNGTHFISGGIFRGHVVSKKSYMGLYETSLQSISALMEKDFLGFLRPGFERQSYSRTFLSLLNRSPMKIDCGMHGEERACINCGTCASVCAVDILPQFMFKSLLADEIEEALSHGLLDCVECGLCTYVCPSKIELCATFIRERQAYCKEQVKG